MSNSASQHYLTQQIMTASPAALMQMLYEKAIGSLQYGFRLIEDINFWIKQDSRFLDGVNTVGYHYGKPYSAFLFTGGFYLGGLLFKSEWAAVLSLF